MSQIYTGIKRTIGPLVAVGLALFVLYLSRFWIWVGPWSTDGLLGLKILSPYGNMANWWLRGTWLHDFDILVWGCGAILGLSLIQIIASRVFR